MKECTSGRRKMRKKKYEECKEVEKGKKRLDFESVKATLDHLGEAVAEFDERLWCNLLDHMVVNDEERVTVIFRDGMEIVVPLGDLVKSRTRTASRKKPTSKRAVARFWKAGTTNISGSNKIPAFR